MRDIHVISGELARSVRAETDRQSAEPTGGGGGRFSYTVKETDGETTVRMILKKRLGFSGRLMAKIKREGTVFRNGVEVRLFADVIAGDVIDVSMPQERCYFGAEDIPIEAVYEDDDIIVVNKQPGIVVHPTRGCPSGTIANGLVQRMEETGCRYKVRFVNRLDRDTSGLLIVAKNSHAQDMLIKEMRGGRIDKRYVAVVRGIIREENGTIDLPVGRYKEGDVRRCVTEDGYPSVTHYSVLERFPDADVSFVELRLETGRTHQIRVHMSYIGHPIVGDTLYGICPSGCAADADAGAPDIGISPDAELIGRQALHAKSLRFRLPVSGDEILIESDLPWDMKKLLDKIEMRR